MRRPFAEAVCVPNIQNLETTRRYCSGMPGIYSIASRNSVAFYKTSLTCERRLGITVIQKYSSFSYRVLRSSTGMPSKWVLPALRNDLTIIAPHNLPANGCNEYVAATVRGAVLYLRSLVPYTTTGGTGHKSIGRHNEHHIRPALHILAVISTPNARHHSRSCRKASQKEGGFLKVL